MKTDNQLSMIAYLSTLAAIVILSLAGALVCVFGAYNSEVNLARVVGALSFIGGAITGLIGVIGTFRPKGDSASVSTQTGDINQGSRP